MQLQHLVFATHNPNKVREVQLMLPEDVQVRSLTDIGCHDPIPELEDTLSGNAKAKALFVKSHFGFDCFADDTGLEVQALNGAPGVHSARYAGPQCDSDANIQKLLQSLEGVSNRKARFRTVIGLCMNNQTLFFEGIVTGEILSTPKGTGGFGYDAVFQPDGYTRSFAEFSGDEKNKISHRGIAFRKLRDYLKKTS